MKKIAKFEKVSFDRFLEDWKDTFPKDSEEKIKEIYGAVKLPKRATKSSAGYDFYLPCPLCLSCGEVIKIPTGIRVWMEENWVLHLYPRSGLGFKYRLQMNNTVGIIDSDYYHAKNEGHIFCKIKYDMEKGDSLCLNQGDAFIQGVFLEYGITLDDETDAVRVGGLGSTSQKE